MCSDPQFLRVKQNGRDRKQVEKCLTLGGAAVKDMIQYLLNLVFKQCLPTGNQNHCQKQTNKQKPNNFSLIAEFSMKSAQCQDSILVVTGSSP